MRYNLLAAVAVFVTPQLCVAQCRDTSQAAPNRLGKRLPTADAAFPAYFTYVVEVLKDGTRNQIITPNPDTLTPSNIRAREVRPNAEGETDVNSLIEIHFDRDWIANHCIAGEISITGHRESDGNPPTTADFPVPGYSEVGKDAQPAIASFSNGLMALTQLHEVREQTRGITNAIDSMAILAAQKDLNAQRQRKASSDSLAARARRLHAAQDRVSQLETSLRAFQLSSATSYDSAPGNGSTGVKNDSAELGRRISELDAARQLEATTERAVAAAAQGDTALNSLLVRTAQDWARDAHRLIEERVGLRSTIAELVDTANSGALRMVAWGTDRTPQALEAQLKSIGTVLAYLERQPAPPQSAEYADSVLALKSRLADLTTNVAGAAAERYIREASLSGLRDAQFSVASTSARPGDVLVIVVTNSDGSNGPSRPYTMRIPVREFGFVRHVTAPVLLVHREGVSSNTEQAAINSAKNAFSNGGSPTVNVPAASNFTPAAGTAMTWTLHRRSGAFLRWLQPGVGVDVSFTNFRTRTVTFTPSASGPQQTESAASDAVQVAVAPVLTVFDGNIVVGAGWNLNVPTKRAFTAVGFNFLNVLENLSGHSSGQK